jgi:prevent-host-death family protein
MKTTAKDLRIHSKRLLEAVDRGEEVTITHRGKPRAKIVPIRRTQPATRIKGRTLPLFGIWKDYRETRDVIAYVDSLRSGRF